MPVRVSIQERGWKEGNESFQAAEGTLAKTEYSEKHILDNVGKSARSKAKKKL